MAEKKKNILAAYFTPFGLKQICDIAIIVAAILLIIGLCITGYTVALIGSIVMAGGALIAVVRCVKVFFSGINKNSAAYKNAIINTVIMGVILALAIFLAIFIAVSYL